MTLPLKRFARPCLGGWATVLAALLPLGSACDDGEPGAFPADGSVTGMLDPGFIDAAGGNAVPTPPPSVDAGMAPPATDATPLPPAVPDVGPPPSLLDPIAPCPGNPPVSEEIMRMSPRYLPFASTKDETRGLFGYMDETGRVVAKAQFKTAQLCRDGNCLAQRPSGAYVLVRQDGSVVGLPNVPSVTWTFATHTNGKGLILVKGKDEDGVDFDALIDANDVSPRIASTVKSGRLLWALGPTYFARRKLEGGGSDEVVIDGKVVFARPSLLLASIVQGTAIVAEERHFPQTKTYETALFFLSGNGGTLFGDVGGSRVQALTYRDGLDSPYLLVRDGEASNQRFRYLDMRAMPLFNRAFTGASRFSEGLAQVQELDGKRVYIDSDGKPIVGLEPGVNPKHFQACLVALYRAKPGGMYPWSTAEVFDRDGKLRATVAEPTDGGLLQVDHIGRGILAVGTTRTPTHYRTLKGFVITPAE